MRKEKDRFTLLLVSIFLITVLFLSLPVRGEGSSVLQNLSHSNPADHQGSYPAGSGNSSDSITIDQIADHYSGDTIIIGGVSNLTSGEIILIQVQSAKTHPGIMVEGNNKSASSSIVIINSGKDHHNWWIYSINTTDWIPGSYRVLVTPVDPNYTTSATTVFNLTDRQNRNQDSVVNETQNPTMNIPRTNVPTTRSTPVPIIIPLLTIGFIVVFRRVT